MDELQILRFIGKYLPLEPAEALSSLLAKTPPLKSLAQNPFFLRSMTRINTSRLTSVGNKGQFLERLYEELLQRETARGLPINCRKITKKVAKLAYRMISRDMIGSQIDLRLRAGKDAQDFAPLLATGLLQSKQEGAVVFYHQLIQEFFAALALRERWVRQRLSILLLRKKWSEVIILWHDIERKPQRLLSRLIDKLKQRNVPFAEPRTMPFGYPFVCIAVYNAYAFFFTMLLIDVVAGGDLTLSAVLHHQLMCLCALIAWPVCIRPIWRLCYYNGTAIGNAAYIISRAGNAVALEALIAALERAPGMLGAACRKQVAEALAAFGPAVVPRLIAELSSRDRWRRIGCIEALGIISDRRALAPLLQLLRKRDVAILSASIEALTRIGGPETGPAVARTIEQLEGAGFWGVMTLTGPLKMSLQQSQECNKELISSLKSAAAKGALTSTEASRFRP